MIPNTFRNPFLPIAGFSLIAIASSHAATITQTVNQGAGTNFNAAVWGTPAAAPTAGNDYVGATGLTTSAGTGFGTSFTGTVRGNGASPNTLLWLPVCQ